MKYSNDNKSNNNKEYVNWNSELLNIYHDGISNKLAI
jgi:hypothetical protein